MKKLVFYGFLFGYSAIAFTGQETNSTNSSGTALPSEKLTEIGLKLEKLKLQKKQQKQDIELRAVGLGMNFLVQLKDSKFLTEQEQKMISAIKDSITKYYEKKSHKSVKKNNN